MRVITINENKREVIVTYVSAFGLQMQSNIEKLNSKEVAKSPRLHIEHTNSYHKTILTRTFLATIIVCPIQRATPASTQKYPINAK